MFENKKIHFETRLETYLTVSYGYGSHSITISKLFKCIIIKAQQLRYTYMIIN
jgi:hypothetical protein